MVAPPSLPLIMREGSLGSIHSAWWSPCGAGRRSTDGGKTFERHGIRAFGIGPHVREIPGTLPETMVRIDQRPVLPAVLGAIQSTLLGFDQRIDNVRISPRNRDADAAQRAFRHTVALH